MNGQWVTVADVMDHFLFEFWKIEHDPQLEQCPQPSVLVQIAWKSTLLEEILNPLVEVFSKIHLKEYVVIKSFEKEIIIVLPTTFPAKTNRYHEPAADSTMSKVEGSARRPVSSNTSRLKASWINGWINIEEFLNRVITHTVRFSLGSTLPAGRYHCPAHVLLASWIINISFFSLNITAITT